VDGEDLFEYEVPADLLRARLGRVALIENTITRA
jgi:hypothetical protein